MHQYYRLQWSGVIQTISTYHIYLWIWNLNHKIQCCFYSMVKLLHRIWFLLQPSDTASTHPKGTVHLLDTGDFHNRSTKDDVLSWNGLMSFDPQCTVYPKKYAHGFVVLCFVVVMQSFIMNSHEIFIHIHQGCFAGTGAIVRLPQCQWSKPDGYGKISQCITTTKHSKAKTVCIFLGIYCTWAIMEKLTGIKEWGSVGVALWNLEYVSISEKTSHHKISLRLKPVRMDVQTFISLWNLAGRLAAMLPSYLPNF